MWVNTDSLLKQLPYFDDSLIAALKEREVEDIAGLMDMQEHDREKALAHLDQSQIELIAKTCNRYIRCLILATHQWRSRTSHRRRLSRRMRSST
jgi:hypothetical protein